MKRRRPKPMLKRTKVMVMTKKLAAAITITTVRVRQSLLKRSQLRRLILPIS